VLYRDKVKRARPPSWRDLMDSMDLAEWLIMLRSRVEAGRRFRLRQLIEQNPTLRIIDGTGRVLVNQSPTD